MNEKEPAYKISYADKVVLISLINLSECRPGELCLPAASVSKERRSPGWSTEEISGIKQKRVKGSRVPNKQIDRDLKKKSLMNKSTLEVEMDT